MCFFPGNMALALQFTSQAPCLRSLPFRILPSVCLLPDLIPDIKITGALSLPQVPTSLKSRYPTFVRSWSAHCLPLFLILCPTLSTLMYLFFLTLYLRSTLVHASYYSAPFTNYELNTKLQT